MDTMLRVLYWFVAGGLIGFGVIGILSIGAPFILLGLILAMMSAIRLGARELWGALLGGGLVPLSILLIDRSHPILPAATGQTYHVMAAIFGAMALLGSLWGLLAALLGLHRPRGSARRYSLRS
jgi:hypothetical protein